LKFKAYKKYSLKIFKIPPNKREGFLFLSPAWIFLNLIMINTALVSFGMSGKVFHAPFIATNPHFNLVGSWERSTKNIEAAYPGTKSYNSYEELLADPNIDLVIVNSPNDTHYTYTKSGLLAGKHVVCEKAFTNTSA
jgi:predicted dehydrogenase